MPDPPQTPTAAPAPLLTARGVSKSFPGVKALDGVDFDVRAGEIIALMGENGAGKSTLIKVLTGVHRRDAGSIAIDGEPIDPTSPRDAEAAGISTVYQEVNLVPALSVAENIMLGRQPKRAGVFIRWSAVRSQARKAMERLGFGGIDVTRSVGSLSLAMQQMVAIARALDVRAKLLILDEPTSSLDEQEVARLFDVMRRLRGDGLGVVFVTHFLDQVYAVSDRIAVLRNGRHAGTFNAADLPRLELVQTMLGRAADDSAGKEPSPAAKAAAAPETSARTADAQHALLEARNLERKGAVGPLDFAIRRGEAVGLAGLLGSGRTELARLLFGADRATGGTIRIDGRPASLTSPRRAIALGFAFSAEDRRRDGIIPSLSVRENLILALQGRRGALRRISPREQRDIAERFIRLLAIKTPSPETPISNLSGGNQQKVLLARWLATEPQLLILDEPTRGIDVGTKAEIESLVRDLCQNAIAVVFVSSELEEIVRTCSRVTVLRDRRIAGELAPPNITPEAVMAQIAEHHEDPTARPGKEEPAA